MLPFTPILTAPQQPNIILFIVDDLGPQDNSLQLTDKPNPFRNVYRTPNLKKLAAESTIYTQAYSASPVCTPTRTSIMTGKHPARTHITYWTIQGDTSADDPVTKPPRWQFEGLLPKDGPFLPELLANAGYQTIHIGKAHFGEVGKFSADPKAIGFQVNIAGHAAGSPGSYYGLQNFAQSVRTNQPDKPSIWDTPGLDKYHGEDIYLTEALALEASAAIKNAVTTKKPFFLNFATYAVHTPIQANKRFLDHYKGLDPREAAYATMVETYDAALGSIVQTLKETKQDKNTIIIFTSDNGGLSVHSRGGNDDRNTPFRAGKGSYYEGGTRIPLVIHTPGKKPFERNFLVQSHDLFQFILESANQPVPKEIDALSFGSRWSILIHVPHFWGTKGQGIEPFSSIRLGDHKLVYKHRSRSYELYDLVKDPSEQKNIIDQSQDLLKSYMTTLRSELRRVDAQMPTEKNTGKAVPLPQKLP